MNVESSSFSKDISTNKTNENKGLFLEKNDEIELTDEVKNARKKRRRSSASI